MKIKTTILLVIILIFTQIFLSPKEASAAQPSVKLNGVKGEVFIRNGGGLRELPAVDGTDLVQGDWLRTGKNSTVTLSYEDGTEATLGASTYLNIQQLTCKDTSAAGDQTASITSWKDGHQSSLQLWSGSIWSKVTSLININDKYEIKTPTAVTSVHGTLYLVSIDEGNGSTQSDVIDGAVGVTQNNESTHASPIQLVTMGQTLRLASLTEPLPNQHLLIPQELINNTQPEILVQLVNDIVQRTQELTGLTKKQQQAFTQSGNIDDITSAIGTSFKLAELAYFGRELTNNLLKSDKLEEVNQVLQDTHQSLEQVQRIIDTLKTNSEQVNSQVVETAKNMGLSNEQINSIAQAATGDSREFTRQPETPPAPIVVENNNPRNPSNNNNPTNTNNLIPAAPIYESAATSTDGTKLLVTFNKAMAHPDGLQAQFNVTVDGSGDIVTAAALNDDSKIIELTLTTKVTPSQSVQVAYTAGTVTASDAGQLASFPLYTVVNHTVLNTVTVNSAVVLDSTHIVLTLSGALIGVSGDPAAFTVVGANTSPNIVDAVVSGTVVTLTLSAPIAYGETISVSYTKTGITDLTNGVLVASFTSQTVTNNLAPAAPFYESATTSENGTKVLVTFNKAMASPNGLQAQFNVTVDGSGDIVTATALNADTKIIELTLTTNVIAGQSVQVAYTAGTVTASDASQLATFLNQGVSNISTLFISSVAPISLTTVTGTAPVLPANVTATLSDGTTSTILVTWSSITEDQYASSGTFIVTGTFANTNVTALANVIALANVTVILPQPDPPVTN